jgi:hypothetical protein
MATSAVPVPVSEKPSTSGLPSYLFPLQPLANVYGRYSAWRSSLGLPNPGTAENLQKEVKSELTNPVTRCHELELMICLNRHTLEQLLLRWSASGPYQKLVDEPGVPGHTLLRPGITDSPTVI